MLVAEESDMRARVRDAIGPESVTLADHLPRILERSDEIRADEELSNALVSECAFFSVAYLGLSNGYLPIGLLLALWEEGSFTGVCDECGGVVNLLGAGGSPLSGSGSMWGLCGSCAVPAKRPFDGRQVLVLDHVLDEAQFRHTGELRRTQRLADPTDVIVDVAA